MGAALGQVRRTAVLLVVGFGLGAATGSGCATSDQVLEKKRRLEEIEGRGGSCGRGMKEDCYEGAKGTAGRGACTLGVRECEDGKWGECAGMVVPDEELCNRLDDDCDGIVDNGFEREGALCFFKGAKGACRTQGKWSCAEDGKTSTCDAPVVKPATETCDGIDNDCDGQTDEDSVPAKQQPCTMGKSGVCNEGTNKCVNGQIRCVQNVQPGAEICNRKDDNCDGVIDDDCVSESEAARLRGN